MLLTDSQYQAFLRAEADLRNLSRAEREAFLRALSGDDITTIADKLQVRPEAIRQRLSQVYQKFEIGGKGPVKLAKLQQQLQTRFQEQQIGNVGFAGVAKRPRRDRPRWDWGEAPDVPTFYGRDAELNELYQWIVEEHCRLVALVGLGGIGKTALAKKLAERIQEEEKFDRLIWRSLRHMPPPETLLADLLESLGCAPIDPSKTDIDSQIAQLVEQLQESKCLLVLDSFDAVLKSGNRLQPYLEGYEAYGKMLRQIGQFEHQSCLLIASDQTFKEIEALARSTKTTRSLALHGLPVEEARKIFQERELTGEDKWDDLIRAAGGNPFLLQIEATSIAELFQGNVAEFLTAIGRDRTKTWSFFYGEFLEILDRQFQKFSDLEKKIACYLARQSKSVSFINLKDGISEVGSTSQILEELVSLKNRDWIEFSKNPKSAETLYELPKFLKKYVKKYQLNEG